MLPLKVFKLDETGSASAFLYLETILVYALDRFKKQKTLNIVFYPLLLGGISYCLFV